MDTSDYLSQFHPHDMLIIKYFPDQDLPSIYEQVNEFGELYRASRECEELGLDPPRVPWPLPPPRSPESLEPGVEEWRKTALRTIDARLSLYARSPAAVQEIQAEDTYRDRRRDRTIPVHRALLLPELLEVILRHATPAAQYAAWHVAAAWRNTIEYILMSQYHSARPCPPVEYGQAVDTDLSWLQPSDEEIVEAEKTAASLSQMTLFETSDNFFPARITQARSLSVPAYDAIQRAYERLWRRVARSLSDSGGRRWLDLSQTRFNHYLLDLLSDRVQLKLGRCEIALKPGPRQQLVYRQPLPDADFARLVGSMFLTEPPCKALGIYVPRLGNASMDLVTKIRDINGIKVGSFLSALQQHSGNVLDTWQTQAAALQQSILEPYWTEFTSVQEKRFAWIYYGFPKFLVFLEHMENEGDEPLAKRIHHHGEDYNGVCESEWYQDITAD